MSEGRQRFILGNELMDMLDDDEPITDFSAQVEASGELSCN